MDFLKEPIVITLSGAALAGWLVVLAFGLIVMIFVWSQRQKSESGALYRLRQSMGVSGFNQDIVILLGLVWLATTLFLFWGLLHAIVGLIWFEVPVDKDKIWDWRFGIAQIAALTTVLGAAIALPFTIIRLGLNRQQTETAAQRAHDEYEGQITDRITKAVAGLGAEKTTSRIGRPIKVKLGEATGRLMEIGGARGETTRIHWQGEAEPFRFMEETVLEEEKWQVFSVTEPNLEVRIGAIYALERIAQDSDRDHVQIMEILCAYIRENAPAKDADPWPELDIKESEDDGPLQENWDKRLSDFKKEHREKISGLTCRSDIQTALTVIGRRSKSQRQLEAREHKDDETAVFVFDLPCPDPEDFFSDHDYHADRLTAYQSALFNWQSQFPFYRAYRLDLRNANLRGADLSDLNLNGAQFSGSELQGTNFQAAQLKAVNLSNAKMQGAYLGAASMQNAYLSEAQMQGTYLRAASMQGANFDETKMQGADLRGARIEGAYLAESRLQGADLGSARMQRACLREARMQGAYVESAQMQGADLEEARLQGTFLGWAQLQGADLGAARMDRKTTLSAAALDGASVRSVDFTQAPQIVVHLDGIFGDGSVTLPRVGNEEIWPKHWPRKDLSKTVQSDGDWVYEFEQEWRKWQKNPAEYKPPEE